MNDTCACGRMPATPRMYRPRLHRRSRSTCAQLCGTTFLKTRRCRTAACGMPCCGRVCVAADSEARPSLCFPFPFTLQDLLQRCLFHQPFPSVLARRLRRLHLHLPGSTTSEHRPHAQLPQLHLARSASKIAVSSINMMHGWSSLPLPPFHPGTRGCVTCETPWRPRGHCTFVVATPKSGLRAGI